MSTSTGCCCMKGAEALEDIRDIMLGGDAMGSIICYDWDGTTLGAVPVSRRATVDDVERLLSEFAAKHTAAEVDGFGYAEDAAKPLSNKAGYKFCSVWLWKGSDAFECYLKDGATYPNGTPAHHDPLSGYTAEQRPSMEAILNRLATEGTAELKAAYEAQANLKAGSDSIRYSVNVSGYGRYGNTSKITGVYFAQIEITRQNQELNPVSRMRQPALIITRQSEGTNIKTYDRVLLGGKDKGELDLPLDKRDGNVAFYVIDMFEQYTWLSATPSSNQTSAKNRENAVAGTDGFVKEGTIAFIYKAAIYTLDDNATEFRLRFWSTGVTAISIEDAGLAYEGKTVTQAKRRCWLRRDPASPQAILRP